MIVQNLKSILGKDSSHNNKEVTVIANNSEYKVTAVSVSVDKIMLNTEKIGEPEKIDSVENQEERTAEEIKEDKGEE